METEIATEKQTLLVGLSQQGGGTAVEYVDTIMRDIGAIETTMPGTSSVDIKSHIVNTMTDRCKTNDAVDRIMGQKLGKELTSFRCAMHPVDGMAKECEKVIKSFEVTNNIKDLKKSDKYPFTLRTESDTKGLLRCADKLFHDPLYNCADLLREHLKVTGIPTAETQNRSVVYNRYIGNRFHLYFLNSGLLYHYNTSLQDFFVRSHIPANAVQQSVANALKLDVLHVTTRALGIIGKVLTGPWMRLVGQDNNILDMNMYYAEAQGKCQSWSQDARQLLRPSPPSVFADVAIKDDVALDSLMKPTFTDCKTITLLQDLCQAYLIIIERQFKDQLPGG